MQGVEAGGLNAGSRSHGGRVHDTGRGPKGHLPLVELVCVEEGYVQYRGCRVPP